MPIKCILTSVCYTKHNNEINMHMLNEQKNFCIENGMNSIHDSFIKLHKRIWVYYKVWLEMHFMCIVQFFLKNYS